MNGLCRTFGRAYSASLAKRLINITNSLFINYRNVIGARPHANTASLTQLIIYNWSVGSPDNGHDASPRENPTFADSMFGSRNFSLTSLFIADRSASLVTIPVALTAAPSITMFAACF